MYIHCVLYIDKYNLFVIPPIIMVERRYAEWQYNECLKYAPNVVMMLSIVAPLVPLFALKSLLKRDIFIEINVVL